MHMSIKPSTLSKGWENCGELLLKLLMFDNQGFPSLPSIKLLVWNLLNLILIVTLVLSEFPTYILSFGFFYFFFFLCHFRATPAAQGGSQARDVIRPVAAGRHHSTESNTIYNTESTTQNPSHVCDIHHSSSQCRILNLVSKARDRTCNLMVTSWVL